jgi:hypothetical protein
MSKFQKLQSKLQMPVANSIGNSKDNNFQKDHRKFQTLDPYRSTLLFPDSKNSLRYDRPGISEDPHQRSLANPTWGNLGNFSLITFGCNIIEYLPR